MCERGRVRVREGESGGRLVADKWDRFGKRMYKHQVGRRERGRVLSYLDRGRVKERRGRSGVCGRRAEINRKCEGAEVCVCVCVCCRCLCACLRACVRERVAGRESAGQGGRGRKAGGGGACLRRERWAAAGALGAPCSRPIRV